MIGEVKKSAGVLYKENEYAVVKKAGVNDKIEYHSHPGMDVIFTVVKGNINVLLNKEESHELQSGDVLRFSGDNYISADLIGDSEAVVVLVEKRKDIKL